MSITAMKQALEALEATENELLGVLDSINADRMHHDGDEFHERLSMAYKAITALRTAIQKAEACEPVAWVRFSDGEVDYDADAVISNVEGDCMDEYIEWRPVFLAAGATK